MILPSDLLIFSSLNISQPLCSQIAHERLLAAIRLALGDLVLVMREDQVLPSAVDVQRGAQVADTTSPSTRYASPAAPAPRDSPKLARLPWRPSRARSPPGPPSARPAPPSPRPAAHRRRARRASRSPPCFARGSTRRRLRYKRAPFRSSALVISMIVGISCVARGNMWAGVIFSSRISWSNSSM